MEAFLIRTVIFCMYYVYALVQHLTLTTTQLVATMLSL